MNSTVMVGITWFVFQTNQSFFNEMSCHINKGASVIKSISKNDLKENIETLM